MTTTQCTCTGCAVQQGTHQPAEALHQQIDEPQAEAMRLADECDESATHWVHEIDTRLKAAKMLRAQHARIEDIEAQHREELRAYEITVANREARIAELEDALRFVERWAVHHGGKPSISAQEALSCIQHYPAIHEITKSYKDGKRPDTFNPYARIAELEGSVTHLENVYGAAIRKVVELEQGKCLHQIAEPAAQAPDEAQIKALMRKHRIWIEHSTLLEDDEPERELRAVQAEEHQFNAFVQDLIAATQLAAAPQAVQAAVPVAWRLTNTAFRKPRFEYHDTKESAEQRQADFNRSVDDGGLHNLTPLYAVPAHPAEGVPAQCPNINEPRGCWRVACQLGGKCREPERSATQPAAQGAATTGYIAPKGRYVPPVLFSPYTGEPRDARDIASDPRGILIVPPGAALAAQAKQGGAA